MRIQTKKNLLRAATAAAVVCVAAVIFLPAVVSAASFTASSTVRVHERPSLTSRVIDTLRPGETVDIGGCRQGWCYVTTDGGFVSSDYLRNNGAAVSPNFNLNFNFPQGSVSIGTDGVQVGIGNAPSQPNRPGKPGGPGGVPGAGEVCFFDATKFEGQRLCLNRGEQLSTLPRGWDDRISSFSNPRGYSVTICRRPGLTWCRTYTTNGTALGNFNNDISSIRVR